MIALLLPALIGVKDLDVDALTARSRFVLVHELREREDILAAFARCVVIGTRVARRAGIAVPRIVKNTRYAVKPMSIEDAALRVDGDADALVVFRNAETDAVSILYRRKDGNLGLIEPE